MGVVYYCIGGYEFIIECVVLVECWVIGFVDKLNMYNFVVRVFDCIGEMMVVFDNVLFVCMCW